MRSRNKNQNQNQNQNQNRRPTTSVINRVFDSSGPEGKVRGTPQQIIEKYQMLARDAQLSGDRVAAENFQQHSEHYARLLGEAMREQSERQKQYDAQQAQQQQNQPNNPPQNSGQQQNQPQHQPHHQHQNQPRQYQPQDEAEQSAFNTFETAQPDTPMVPVREMQEAADSGLVETPESAVPAPSVKKRVRRAPKVAKPDENSESNAAE